jgi:hypothetical protein
MTTDSHQTHVEAETTPNTFTDYRKVLATLISDLERLLFEGFIVK